MSTRSTTHFIDSNSIDPETQKPYLSAIVYRHSDGYPEGAGCDLRDFLQQVGELNDTRFNDAPYLAAKYVVFLSRIFGRGKNPLEFMSVGIMSQDPMDIEYRYTVDCGKLGKDGRPEISCYGARSGKHHDIPLRK